MTKSELTKSIVGAIIGASNMRYIINIQEAN